MTGEFASQASLHTGPVQPLADNSMVEAIKGHKQKLEEIRKKLHPSKLREVDDTTVKDTFLPDILSVFTYIEDVVDPVILVPYIRNPDLLYEKLNEIILVLYDALEAWDTSLKVEDVEEELKATSIYRKHLNTCYGLLKEALGFFNPVQQVQQGTSPGGNTESMSEKP